MVEGGDEFGRRRQQHPVAEHVARHVADADHGEGRGLDVDVHLAKMPLHRHPRTAGGDAHLLVVVAVRAAAGEGVAEPVAVRLGDAIGGIGEGRGPLVGRDDEIGIVAVAPYHVLGRDDAAALEVVGDVEEAGDVDLVGRLAFGDHRGAVGGRREPLRHVAALRADRHDHRVLRLLGLGQPEHLGAEIEGAIGPADAAARHRPEAEVHALDPRAVDEDLAERSRRGQLVHPMRIELEDDLRPRRPVRPGLEEVRPHRRFDDVEEAADDPVLVEALDRFERRFDPPHDRFRSRVVDAVGIEPAAEQRDQRRRDLRMAPERRPHGMLGERRARLAEIARDRPNQRNVPPRHACVHGERVEAVALRLAEPDRHERRQCEVRRRREVERLTVGPLQVHVVDDHQRRTGAAQLVGLLVDHPKAEILEHRHPPRQRNRRAEMKQLQPDPCRIMRVAAMERTGDRPFRGQFLHHRDVVDRRLRHGGVAVAGRERAAPGLSLAVREVDVAGAAHRGGEIVLPVGDDLLDLGLERRLVGVRRGAAGPADDEVHPHQRPFGKRRLEGRDPAVEGAGENLADPHPDVAVVAVARREDEDGDVAVETIAAGEHPHPWSLAEGEDLQREVVERVLADREQLVARIGLEDVRQRFAGMARRVEAGAAHHPRHLLPDVGYGIDRAGIGFRGEQAEEARLAGEAALRVVALDPHIVGVGPAMDPGNEVRFPHHQRLGPLQEGADRRRHRHALLAPSQHADLRIAKDAEAGRIGARQPAARPRAGVVIVADAEEREGAVGQPFKERDRLGQLRLRNRRRRLAIGGDRRPQPVEHGGPVRHRPPHLDEQRPQPLDQLAPRLGSVDPVEMDLDQALADRALGHRPCAVIGDEPAGPVAGDADDRMGDETDVGPESVELGQRRIEKERHVVVEDAEHADLAARRSASRGGVVEADHRLAGLPLAEQRVRGPHEGGEIGPAIDGKVLEADMGEQVAGELPQSAAIVSVPAKGTPRQADEPVPLAILPDHSAAPRLRRRPRIILPGREHRPVTARCPNARHAEGSPAAAAWGASGCRRSWPWHGSRRGPHWRAAAARRRRR